MKASQQLVRLRVKTAFANFKAGDVIERTSVEAERMLGLSWYGHKLVERVQPPPESSESPPPPVRGRKRKEMVS